MSLVCVGLNHKTAPVEVRERLAFADPGQASAALTRVPGVIEAVVVSTCNRAEIYVNVDLHGAVAATAPATPEALPGAVPDARGLIAGFLSSHLGVPADLFREHLYVHDDIGAVSHLFTVGAGLDSMILGETQILGQIKDCYLAAKEKGATGKVLSEVFERALRTGKRGHSETAISQNAVSVSYAAVELARKVFHSLEGRQTLIIGAGKMSELVAKDLEDDGLRQVVVANRTFERAEEMAARFGGRAARFDEVPAQLTLADVVISSTSAPGFVLTPEMVRTAMRQRRARPLFLIDIAVPRDVDPACGRIENVFLYDIDDLQAVVEANLEERRREAKKVERIVDEEARSFDAWFGSLDAVPLIRLLRAKAETIRRAELEKALARMPGLDEKERAAVEAMSSLIINKLLNDPTLKLKELAMSAEGKLYLRAASELFNLKPGEEGERR
ncbi:MAG: glutamyl-tRNA reductase [Bacillota bacterium]